MTANNINVSINKRVIALLLWHCFSKSACLSNILLSMLCIRLLAPNPHCKTLENYMIILLKWRACFLQVAVNR